MIAGQYVVCFCVSMCWLPTTMFANNININYLHNISIVCVVHLTNKPLQVAAGLCIPQTLAAESAQVTHSSAALAQHQPWHVLACMATNT